MKKAGRKPQIISGTEKTEYRRNGSEYFQKRSEQAWNFQKINHLTVNLINEYQRKETPVFDSFRGENRTIPAFRECNSYIIAHSTAKTPQSKV